MHDRGAKVKSRLSHTDRQRERSKGHSPRFRGPMPDGHGAGPGEKILRTVVSLRKRSAVVIRTFDAYEVMTES